MAGEVPLDRVHLEHVHEAARQQLGHHQQRLTQQEDLLGPPRTRDLPPLAARLLALVLHLAGPDLVRAV